MKTHRYKLNVLWKGNRGSGTLDYASYDRDFEISSNQKPVWSCSSDTAFRGNPERYNPEDMLIASLSSCHMLWYLHLCADHGIIVDDYSDQPEGTMIQVDGGGGRFTEMILNPRVVIRGSQLELAKSLHHKAHEKCFIANSVNFEVKIQSVVSSNDGKILTE